MITWWIIIDPVPTQATWWSRIRRRQGSLMRGPAIAGLCELLSHSELGARTKSTKPRAGGWECFLRKSKIVLSSFVSPHRLPTDVDLSNFSSWNVALLNFSKTVQQSWSVFPFVRRIAAINPGAARQSSDINPGALYDRRTQILFWGIILFLGNSFQVIIPFLPFPQTFRYSVTGRLV